MASALRAALGAALASVALLVLPASPASAITATCGMTVTADLKLTNDLTDCPGDGLKIGAAGIKINLKNHRIDGVIGAGGRGIYTNGYSDVTVTGGKKGKGTVSQFDKGVLISGGIATVKRLKVTRSDDIGVEINSSNQSRLLDSRVLKTRAYGVEIVASERAEVGGNLVKGPESSNVSNAAIIVNNGLSHDNVIEENRVVGGGQTTTGVLLNGTSDGTILRRNEITATDSNGVLAFDNVTDTLIKRNAIHDNSGDGIQVGASSGSGGQLLGNLLELNGGDGIDVQKAGVGIGDNEAVKNGGWGIVGVAGVVDAGGNAAHGNDLGQCQNVSC